MYYKAIIFDLDGTAMPSAPNGLPSDRVVRTVQAAKRKIRLCAATGRGIRNAKPILDRLGLEELCVIAAGTQIIDPKTDEILWEVTMNTQDVWAILDVCRPYPHEIIIRDELMGEGGPAVERIITGNVNVMYVMECTHEDGREILRKLAEIPTITAVGVLAWSGQGLDIHITNREATKEHSIAELLRLLGLRKEEVAGVGDGANDVHLFKSVGYKVAMGNAVQELKDAADIVCDNVDNDGLAKLIEELVP